MSDVYEARFGPRTPESWLSRHTPYVLLLAYLYHCTQITIELFDEFFYFYRVMPLVENAILYLFAAAAVGVIVRAIFYAARRASWTTIVKRILGEPTWWRTWYPRFLRDPASVWDRMPLSLKLLRTGIWLELLLLPAGLILVTFVTPTFQTVYASIGVASPLAMRSYATLVNVGGYLLPVVLVGMIVQYRHWRTTLGLSSSVALSAFFSNNPNHWQNTSAYMVLNN
jgi:hypothetical protein